MTLPPLIKTITVPVPQEAAFRRFTIEMATWWPIRTHSTGEADAERCVFEGKVGGRIYEVIRGGREALWGTVTAWDPPRRIAFTWHPGNTPDKAQDVEVRFEALEGSTRVVLTHTKWEVFGARARRARRGYGIGWGYVLGLYARRRWSPSIIAIGVLGWVISRIAALRTRASESLS